MILCIIVGVSFHLVDEKTKLVVFVRVVSWSMHGFRRSCVLVLGDQIDDQNGVDYYSWAEEVD